MSLKGQVVPPVLRLTGETLLLKSPYDWVGGWLVHHGPALGPVGLWAQVIVEGARQALATDTVLFALFGNCACALERIGNEEPQPLRLRAAGRPEANNAGR